MGKALRWSLLSFALITIGFLLGWVLTYTLLRQHHWNEHAQYHYQNGVHQGRIEAADAIKRRFGTVDSTTTSSSVFNAKDRAIVAIKIDGIETVREHSSATSSSQAHALSASQK